ncbi:MAG TPA: helix-turn-helix transcriptional regulator [Terrimesophilobacter sp.]|nr:helix-turn-helix transcriptional regulator [Terrimesophilobacter sp.]HRQ00761.1 helix-turn-helix transcriptional regulator [Terrimesophilobacter sp.]
MTHTTARLRVPADFGLAIQQARLARGLSQSELAAEVGIPQSTLSQLENGNSTIFLRRLLAIAQATGVELSATWGGDGAPRD